MYKIIVDSCGEFTKAMEADTEHFAHVALTLQVGSWEQPDDETFDQKIFLKKMKESKEPPHSACPSPAAYLAAIEDNDADHVYIITLSSKLSGSYNAAVLAKSLYEEDHEDEDDIKRVHVFDSKSASIGQTLIAQIVDQAEKAGRSFDEVIKTADEFIKGEHTFFVLESLETLRKAGRLGSLKAMLASTLNIKPVMGSTPEGSIQQLGQARGMIKALDKMIECMKDVTMNPGERVVAISHCAAPDTASSLKEKVKRTGLFKDVFVLDTIGVSSMYAGPGGIIMAV
ncbi:MAG: DegV family protein [Lachnospiraceae bacterium]|uniref:DegV family protein n=1 Tax=Candidatus Weimeria bifida TaxID=2599074 RepID=A0A6N7J0L0_9FIRM|nr:DegV family protein [Candidatus Weimeria bifida]RRF97084.1 MAG: DegV family protein [Lachnospiraceae bacterium]